MIPQNLQKGEQYYRNFRPLTRTADYPHRSIFAIARKKFRVQLINFHTFCLRCFIEDDTNCKNLFKKKMDITRSTESEKSLETGKYSLTQGSAS